MKLFSPRCGALSIVLRFDGFCNRFSLRKGDNFHILKTALFAGGVIPNDFNKVAGVPRHRPFSACSHSTSVCVPIRRSICRFCAAAQMAERRWFRSFLILSGIWPGMRSASVPGRFEKQKIWPCSSSSSSIKAQVCSNSASVSPGKPTMTSAERHRSGIFCFR